MKKIVFVAIALLAGLSSQSQNALYQSKFTDNWSIGLNGTAVTPLTHHAFLRNMRGGVSLDINKQISPVFGLTIEGSAYFNSSEGAFTNLTHASTIVDATNVSLLGRVNFMNLFGGYKGTPRCFELEAVAGAGWIHTFGNTPHTNLSAVSNNLSAKAGLNFNFNLGAAKVWTVSVKPAVIWNTLDRNPANQAARVRLNGNNASVELAAGITYHFKNSNGTHHFATGKLYDQAEIDGLNANINSLRENLGKKTSELGAANNTIDELNKELTAARNKKPIVETIVKNNSTTTMESVVTFGQGKTAIAASQLPNVERIATYMKNHKDATVSIKGFASPEGSAEINAKIADARANAVKDVLIKKYKIDAKRIVAEGAGVGNMFSEPDWNRVSICTLDETK